MVFLMDWRRLDRVLILAALASTPRLKTPSRRSKTKSSRSSRTAVSSATPARSPRMASDLPSGDSDRWEVGPGNSDQCRRIEPALMAIAMAAAMSGAEDRDGGSEQFVAGERRLWVDGRDDRGGDDRTVAVAAGEHFRAGLAGGLDRRVHSGGLGFGDQRPQPGVVTRRITQGDGVDLGPRRRGSRPPRVRRRSPAAPRCTPGRR